MKAPGSRRPAPAPRAQGGIPIAAFSVPPEASREAPSALTAAQGHLDALRALQAALPPLEFWTPKVLWQVPQEAVEAFLDQLVVEDGQKDRTWGLRGRLARAREIRTLQVMDRALELGDLLRMFPPDESVRRAMAWASGLPLEVAGGALPPSTLSLGSSPIRWLPAGLAIEGVWADESGLEDLPEDLRVSGMFDLSDCPGIREIPEGLSLKVLFVSGCPLRRLPQRLSFDPAGPDGGQFHMKGCRSVTTLPEGLVLEELAADQSGLERLPGDLVVKGTFYLRGTPLARLSDAEIRAMAPGVTGEISR